MVPRFIISLAFVFLFHFLQCVFIGYKSTRIISIYIYVYIYWGGEGEWVQAWPELALSRTVVELPLFLVYTILSCR